MRSPVAKIAATVSAAVLLVGVAACGSDNDSVPAAGRSKPAAATTSTPGDAVEAAFLRTVSGAQAAARTSHVSMTIEGAGAPITAEGDVALGDTPADTSMSMTMNMGSSGLGSMSMILVDQKLYMNLGRVSQDKYRTADLTDPDDPIAQQMATITDQLDPSGQLAQFEKALTSMEKKGEPVTIDGATTQPYELTVDTSRIAGLADVGAGASLPESLTYTMYIGQDDLLRRVTSQVVGTTITADYTRWGRPVDVQAPPTDQISDEPIDGPAGS